MKDVSIASIEVKNYKLCKDAKIRLDGNLTALLGKNGAGKTTILQAVELLHSATESDPSTVPFFDKLNRKDFDVTTVIANIYWHGRKYDFILDAYFQKDTITARPKRSRYWLVDHDTGVKHDYQDISFILAYGNIKYRHSLDNFASITGATEMINEESYNDMIAILEYIHDIVYVETSDFLGSSHNHTTLEISNRNGYGTGRHGNENMVFLKDLYELKNNRSLDFKKYRKIVSRIGGGLVDDIEFEPLQLPKSSVQLYKNGKLSTVEETRELIVPIFTIGENKLYNNQLSEGTFRALALVFYILNSKASLVILEEPELSVHYELLADLIGIIRDSAKEAQIIISTHSERIVDLLSYQNIVIVSRDNEGVHSKPLGDGLSLNDKHALDEFIEDGGGLSSFISSDS